MIIYLSQKLIWVFLQKTNRTIFRPFVLWILWIEQNMASIVFCTMSEWLDKRVIKWMNNDKNGWICEWASQSAAGPGRARNHSALLRIEQTFVPALATSCFVRSEVSSVLAAPPVSSVSLSDKSLLCSRLLWHLDTQSLPPAHYQNPTGLSGLKGLGRGAPSPSDFTWGAGAGLVLVLRVLMDFT